MAAYFSGWSVVQDLNTANAAGPLEVPGILSSMQSAEFSAIALPECTRVMQLNIKQIMCFMFVTGQQIFIMSKPALEDLETASGVRGSQMPRLLYLSVRSNPCD